MAEVAKLRPDDARAVAVATGIVVGITNDRQITFQTGHEGHETPEVVFRRYLGVMQIADRLKAHYEVPEIEEELFKHRETLANFLEDKARLEANHEVQVEEWKRLRPETREKKLADMNAQILDMQEKRKEFHNQGVEEHRRSGRQGSFTPRGNLKATLDRIDLGIKQAGEARDSEMEKFDADYDAMIAKAQAEKDQALANLGISIERYQKAIAEREERLAKRRAIAEG
jgi:hypothetical protein